MTLKSQGLKQYAFEKRFYFYVMWIAPKFLTRKNRFSSRKFHRERAGREAEQDSCFFKAKAMILKIRLYWGKR